MGVVGASSPGEGSVHGLSKAAIAIAADDELEGKADDGVWSGKDLMSRNSSETQESSVDSQIALTARTQCLRFETITDRESRWAALAIKLVVVLGDLGAVALVIVKRSKRADELLVMNKSFVIMQITISAVLLLALLLGFTAWAWRVATSIQHGMTWTKRRAGVAQLTAVRGVLVSTIITAQLTINAQLLADPATFCDSRHTQPLLDAVTWLAWDVMLLSYLLEAHGTNLLPQHAAADAQASGKGSIGTAGVSAGRAGRAGRVVWDLPMAVHWPKLLLLWVPFAALVVAVAVLSMDPSHALRAPVPAGAACVWGATLECTVSPAFGITTMLTYAFVGLYFAAYAGYLFRAWLQLKGAQYQKYRMANLVLRVQFRFNGAMMTALFVGMTLTVCIGGTDCANFATTWLGNPPVAFIFTSLQLLAFYLSFPRRHDFLETRRSVPPLLLQQFAWTEADVPRRRAAWQAALAPALPASPAPGGELSAADPRAALSATSPLFCFETAIKLFFWSVLVYAYEEAGESGAASLAAMPAPIREILGEMDAAMRLFGLRKRRLFYDRACGTKALLAWSDSVILLTFRGSKERANFVQDARFLQTPHPPKRKFQGRTPRVHQGFLTTWHAHGVHDAVLSLIRDLLAAVPNPDEVRVLCTGHSLGGAVAQLASFDIVRELGVAPVRVSVYTFGCPRIGNRALAAEFAEVVPDTWHVINDQDVVTREMRFFGVYKRAGQRAIINRRGDLIVRPAHFEVSMLQTRFLSRGAAHHATVGYQRALVAIILAQLQDSSRHADGLHGLLGLLKQLPQVRHALEAHARGIGASVPDLLEALAPKLLTPRPATLPVSAAAAGPPLASDHLTPSRHASLLRALDANCAVAAAPTAETPAAPESDSDSGLLEAPDAVVEMHVPRSDA
eukprot:jgi/Ulvmu1/2806/UM142_0004.1